MGSEPSHVPLLPFVLAAAFVAIAALPSGSDVAGVLAFGLAGLGCSALLPLTISFGQADLVAMSADDRGFVIAAYQLGYGIAAFGAGPLQDAGVTLLFFFAIGAVVVGFDGRAVVRYRPPDVTSSPLSIPVPSDKRLSLRRQSVRSGGDRRVGSCSRVDACSISRPRPDRRAGRVGDVHPRRPRRRRHQGGTARWCGVAAGRSPVEGEPPSLTSLRFHAYNRGKRSVEIDLDHPAGRREFLDLVSSADFLFEDAGPGVMEERGLGFEALRDARPDLVYVAISPFGQTGPYAHHMATDLTLSAMGGSMALNGDADRRPVRITVPQTWHHAAAESALGSLVAHERRRRTGEAQFVDVSVQAAVFWTGLQAMIASAIDGRNIERNGTVLQLSTLVTPLVYPCADGEVCLIATSATLVGLMPWMVETGAVTEEWAAQEDWRTYEARMLTAADALVHSLDDVRAAITAFTRMQSKSALFEGGIARGVTLAPVNTVADVLQLDHLVVRHYWDDLKLPSGRVLRAPGAFVKASETPISWTSPAPDVGEHTRSVLDALDGSLPASARARLVRSRRSASAAWREGG